ncbi:MAG: DUF4835 family protein [Bacteroidales bacterium]|nr:DUF4835 family protein [Bacteroidales bacterium]
MSLRGALISVILGVASWALNAQELNCTVEINSQQVANNSQSVFQTLQEAISEYMNTNKFTQAQFSPTEKIECRMFFTISDYTDGVMTGDLQVQSSRPVFDTSYTTTLINFKDSKLQFEYQEGEPLVFSENVMQSQLTAILNFYAYLILAVDFDTFSSQGGQAYYDKAATVVQLGQSSGQTGWKAFEDNRNRSAVLSGFTDPSTSGIRELLYQYHRKGLDEMVQSPDKSRANITKALAALTKIQQVNSMSVVLSMWRDAKLDEIVNIYSQAPEDERKTVYDLLTPIYPTDRKRLEQIKNPEVKK